MKEPKQESGLQYRIVVNAREYDTIIAALRARQGMARTSMQDIEEIATEHGDALTSEEIDALIERVQ